MKRNSSKKADNTARKRAGFTLVELVVVIAVLAILAGVGAVAYRGYIKKGQEAADLEKLAAIKTAACAMLEESGDTCALIKVDARETKGKITRIWIYPKGDVAAEYDKDGMCYFKIYPENNWKIELQSDGSPGKDKYDTDSFIEYLSGNTFEIKSEKFITEKGTKAGYSARWGFDTNDKWK